MLSWTLNEFLTDEAEIQRLSKQILTRLSEKAQEIPVREDSPVALDWLNGRRTPFADQTLKGMISGLTLGTTAPDIFRSLVEATGFGSKSILEHLHREGVLINEVIGVGGISKKSPFVMQTLSDIMGIPIQIATTEQAGALGAAMCSATAAGIFEDLDSAQTKLGRGFDRTFYPNKETQAIYAKLYAEYLRLGKINIH